MSEVITKHLRSYRNSFYKWFYRVILTTVFLMIFCFKTNIFGDFKQTIGIARSMSFGLLLHIPNVNSVIHSEHQFDIIFTVQ